jgi:hypothetical protein
MPKLNLPNLETVVAIDIHTHAEEPSCTTTTATTTFRRR